MNVKSAQLLRGIAQRKDKINGREMSFVGAWDLIIKDDNDRNFSIELLVPGSPDSLSGVSGVTAEDWATNDYAIELSAFDHDGHDFPVSTDNARELKSVLQQIESGELRPEDFAGQEFPSEFVNKIVKFFEPRIEYAQQNLEGGTIALRSNIEASMSNPNIPRV